MKLTMMISKSYKILWVCFILMFTSTQFIIAQDFYISDSNGSDNNSGTLEAPFKTINKGISMVSAGGTVYVMDGIYQNENYGNVDPSTNTNMDNQHVVTICLLYTSPSPRDKRQSRMPSSA